MGVIERASPNFDDRDPQLDVSFIVLHYTNMKTSAEALGRLCDPASRVSAHYLIDEKGQVFRLVDEGKRAWHAGQSFWRGLTDLNSASIGIELANPGHLNGYRPFPDAQIHALIGLLPGIIARHGMSARSALLGHSDVAPQRKEDPGELFPWRELAEEGFGVWPEPQPQDRGAAEEAEVQNLLRVIGYDCPSTGAYDRPTRAALIAFQRRFQPDNMTGTPELETVARLRALARVAGSRQEFSRPAEALPPRV